MAINILSYHETFSVVGTTEEWINKIEQALQNGGFKKVVVNNQLNQIIGSYKMWGKITVTLFPENDRIKLHVISSSQKTINQFKQNK